MTPTSSSQSAMTSTIYGPVDLRTLRLKALVETHSHEGRNGLFLSKLPLELFLHAASFLPWRSVVQASHVCVAWRKALTEHQELWTELERVDYAIFEEAERARVFASRAKGQMRSLTLDINQSGESTIELLPVMATLRQILRDVSVLDGGRKIEKVELILEEYRDLDDIEPAFQAISVVASFVQWAAVNVKTLTIKAPLPRYSSGAPFFVAAPSVQHLTLTSLPEEPFQDARLPELLSSVTSLQESQITSVALRTLTLSGTSLMDESFPSFPFLHTIKLHENNVSNLYGLLDKVSGTLKHLSLRNIKVDPPFKFRPRPEEGVEKDVPPIISLPYLEKLEICGSSPVIFGVPKVDSGEFMTDVPMLKIASFAEQHPFDGAEMGYEMYPSCSTLSTASLVAFFRSATSLQSVDFSNTNVTTEMLFASLPYASSTLQSLKLISVASDSLIDRLDVLVPFISHLNVQTDHFDHSADPPHSTTVSLTSLARLASRLRSRSSPLTSLTIFANNPYPVYNTLTSPPITIASLKNDLRTSLIPLSPSQIEICIASTLTISDYPGAEDWRVVKEEVLALATPSVLKPGQQGFVPANSQLVKGALDCLKKWQKRKEFEACKEFLEKEGVKLWFGGEDEEEA